MSSIPKKTPGNNDLVASKVLFCAIPQLDLSWVQAQKPSVIQLFHECWLSDPYGSRLMKLTTKLKKSAFSVAKKILQSTGLFIFKPDPSSTDGRVHEGWMIQNLHGSRVKSFWKGAIQVEEKESVSAEDESIPTEDESIDVEKESMLAEDKSVITEDESTRVEDKSMSVDSNLPETEAVDGFQVVSESFQYSSLTLQSGDEEPVATTQPPFEGVVAVAIDVIEKEQEPTDIEPLPENDSNTSVIYSTPEQSEKFRKNIMERLLKKNPKANPIRTAVHFRQFARSG